MAYTKIHAIKATVDKAIDYICNPEKTDEKMFVSSYACSPETAAYDFKYTLDHCRENSPNKAYHLIQAFAPGEVGFEEAHHIGKELADKLLEGKYSYVVTTHIDKEHVHNHIIFCAADNIEHNKYHDCKQSYYHIRKLSDELCKEHNLSVIIPGAQRGNRSYHIGYKKAKNPDAYFRRYESQIILYGGARRMLEQAGINLKGLNVDKLKAEYQELMKQKNELTSTYKDCEMEVRELNRKLENLNQYLGRTQPDPAQEQQTKKDTPNL